MAEPQGRIFDIITLEKWFETRALEYNFFRADISYLEAVVQQEEEQSVDSTCTDPEDLYMLHHLRQTNSQYQTQDLGIICKLANERYLTRTFNPTEGAAEFLILDKGSPNYTACKFMWNLQFFYQNFGYGRAGGCCIPAASSIKFNCWTNSSGHYALLAGPAEHGNPGLGYIKQPTAKLYNSNNNIVEEFQITIPGLDESGSLGWPAEVLFDPREDHEDDLTMICSTQSTFCLESWWVEGIILRYNLSKHTISAIYQRESMCTSLLQYLCGGEQVVCIEPETYDSAELDERQLQSVRIFHTDTLTPLFVIPGLRKESVFNHSVLSLYSDDESVMAIVLWRTEMVKKASLQRKSNGQVMLCINPLPKKLRKLTAICRSVILSINRGMKYLESLPLPSQIIKYLEGIEQLS